MLSFSEEKTKKSNGLDAALAKASSLEEECRLVEAIGERNPEAVMPLLMDTLKRKHHLRQKLEEWSEKLNASQWRPAIFLRRLDAFADRALVAIGGQRLSVAIAPDVDPDGLEIGAAVFLDAGANLLVSFAPEILPVGLIGVYSRPHGDRAVLVGPGEEEIVVEIGRNLRSRTLSPGDLLVFDREIMVAIDVVGSRHQKASILRTLDADKSIEELGGLDGVFYDIVSEIELHLVHREIVRDHQLKPVKGILLSGPPGVGKTSLIKCLARKLNQISDVGAKVFLAPPSIHRSKWYGESEERVRAMFAEARKAAEDGTYTLLVFDDVDQLGSRDGVHGVDSRILPSFLHEIDDLRSVERVLLVGSTNRPDLLDRALLREGRFGDRQYQIPRPGSRQATTDILTRYLPDELPYRNGGPRSMIESATSALYAPNGELATLATLHFRSGSTQAVTPSMLMSGALIEAAVAQAKLQSCHRAVRQEPAGIGADDLLAAFDDQLSAVVDRLRPETARPVLDLPPDLDVVKVEPIPRNKPRRHEFTSGTPARGAKSERALHVRSKRAMEREKKRPTARKPKRVPAPSRSSLAEDLQFEETPEASVRVIFGASVQQLSLAGLTVERAQELAGTILNADTRSPVLVNGRLAGGAQVLAAGDTIEIVHHAGEKGRGAAGAPRP